MCHWEGEGDKDKALNVFLVVDNKKSTQNKDFFFKHLIFYYTAYLISEYRYIQQLILTKIK